ncbi:MAG: hypothetical protein H6733_02720 [Alphaproteobacteria bacterium]|nr:hypothetical protein [Alphaproteobacteria bacterium]
MDPEDVVTRPPLPWKGVAIVTASAAVAAVVVNLGVGWLLELPDGATVPDATAPLVASADAGGVGDPAAVGATTPGGTRAVRVPSAEEYRTTILARNLFDHNRIGVVIEEEGGGEGDDVSNLPVTLRGTIVAEPAELSAAFIEEQGKPSAYAYGIGQSVQGAEILEILDDRVKLLNHGREEWLLLGETTKGSGGAPVTAAAPPEPGTGMEGVEQKSETEFVVSRSLLDEKLNDLSALTREARALLHRGPDGEYDGYRLSAIRRGSVLDMLGVRNGDIIHSANGLDLNSVEGAMKALSALKGDGSLKFEVTRRGQPVTLSYDIR